MNKGENMTTYFTRITQVRDELGAIREVIESAELVRTTLDGVTKPWVVFVELVVARENMSSLRLWDDFIQDETCRGYIQGNTSHNKDDEENVALAAKGKKKKYKKGSKGGTKQQDGEKDMSKVICFACQKFGHYARQCPNKKKKKQQTSASAEIDEYAARFEREFSLFVGGCRERESSIINRDIED